ncbi:MAG: four helix bundle protein [Terriglobia bacterium]|jgi:four helix bundle protein
MVKCYRDLKVWQKAMDLVLESYRLTRLLPKSETFGLASQTQRAAVSIPANIAEGHGREHLGDYLRHLSIASGSLMELETHLLIITRLYIAMDEVKRAFEMVREVDRMLSGLTKRLKELPAAA